MGLERIRHKSGIAGVGGKAQSLLGWLLLAAGLLVMLLPNRSTRIGYYILYCLGALVLACGLRLVLRGHTTKRLVGRLEQLERLFQNTGRVPLNQVASYLRCSLSELVGDVRAMQARGFVNGLYADLIRRDLVSAPGGVDVQPPQDAADDIELCEENRASVAPIYALGFSWVLWAIGLPLYTMTHFVLCAAVSAAVFVLVKRQAPERVVIVERQKAVAPPARTGNEALDEMLQAAQGHMDALRRLDREITSGKADEVVREILRTTEQIINHVKQNPNSAGQIRQFLGYTLPTTISLLQNYQELSRQRVQGENITQAREKIEGMMDTILAAFHRQLDALFRDRALNIEVELDVMQQMLDQQKTASSGLGDLGNDFK